MILLFAAAIWLIAFAFAIVHASPLSSLLTKGGQRGDYFWRDLLAIGLLGLLTLGFFWRVLFGNAWIPAGGGDLANFLYPTYLFAAEWWRRGVVPLWNPYLFAGLPFLGDIQSGIFYPINLLTFFLSSPLSFRDMEYLSILHFFIAGMGMYFFLRFGSWNLRVEGRNSSPLPLSRLACLAGAIAFEFSDLFITHFGNLNLIAVAAWMPLVLLFYRRAVLDRHLSSAAVSGIFLAIAFHAGHIQSFLFILLGLIAFAIYHTLDLSQKNVDTSHLFVRFRPRLIALYCLALVALVAIGLSAPALVPAIEFTQHTVRAEFSYEQAAQFSLPPAQLIGLFVPGFFGRGPQNAWGPWERVEVGYVGILPLVLALLAIILRRDSLSKFFAIFSLFGLALTLGGYGILHGWLFQFVPGFGQLRAPARFVFLFDFGIASLAAFALDMFLHALSRGPEIIFKRFVRAAPWVFLLIALAAGSTAYAILILGQDQDAVLFQRIANATNSLAFFIVLLALSLALIVARATRFFRPRLWAISALALIFLDLFSLGAYVDIDTDDPSHVFNHSGVVTFLKSDSVFYRIDPRGTNVDSVWTADTAIVLNLFSIDGDNPLVLSDFDKYWNAMGSRSSVLYDLLNVKYLIGRKGIPLDNTKFKLAFDGDSSLNIFENTRVLPRAFVAFSSRIVPDHFAAFDAIHAADFDPVKTAVLESPTSDYGQATDGIASVTITSYSPNAIELKTNLDKPGFLVLSEIYDPNWRVYVYPGPLVEYGDLQEVKLERVDYLFRGVWLPQATQRVRFSYDPPMFKVGVGLFVVTLFGLITWGVIARWHKG
jgi:hypothetical protein